MSRDQRRRLLRKLRDAGFTVDAGSGSCDLTLGPPPRTYRDWPAREGEALAQWNRTREAVMAAAEPGRRPWAYFWYDVPHAETIPGPQRDANLDAGRLTPAEADMMARAHTAAAFARIAASRPGQSTADWLADPRLIESSIGLLGWNPFDAETIAHPPANEQKRQAADRQKEPAP